MGNQGSVFLHRFSVLIFIFERKLLLEIEKPLFYVFEEIELGISQPTYKIIGDVTFVA